MRLFTFMAAVSAVFALACDGGDSPEPTPKRDLSLRAWADAVCSVAEDLEAAVESVRDDLDPSTLSLDDRKARAARIDAALIPALDDARSRWQAIAGPPDTAEYQRALGTQARQLADELRSAGASVAAATDGSAFEAANDSFEATLTRTQQATDIAARLLPVEALTALRSVVQCGSLIRFVDPGAA